MSEELLEEQLTTEYNHLNLLKEKSNFEIKQMEDEEAKIGGESAITVARTSLADAEIRFENVYPTSLGSLSYDVRATDVDYLNASVSFNYMNYNIVQISTT